MKDAVKDLWQRFLRECGIESHEAGAPSADGKKVRLQVYLVLADNNRTAVGLLWKDEKGFVFQYEPSFAKRKGSVPISAFPDLAQIYRSEHLWPFFSVRVPPLEREDVRKLVEEKKIPKNDVLRLLGELSAKAVASPYRFALE